MPKRKAGKRTGQRPVFALFQLAERTVDCTVERAAKHGDRMQKLDRCTP